MDDTGEPKTHRLGARHIEFVMLRLETLLDRAPTCPMCRRAHWQVNDRVDVWRADGGIIAHVHLRCVECGFVASFDALRLELIGPRGGLISSARMRAMYEAMSADEVPIVPIPDRALWWRWVTIVGFDRAQPALAAEFGGGDVAVGFLYLDPGAGANVRLDHVARRSGEGLVETGRVPADKPIILRPGSYRWEALSLRVGDDRPAPLGTDVYARPALEPLRARTELDPHRAPGYPDDVQVVLLPPVGSAELTPEAVWVRLTGETEAGDLEGTLLSQPQPRHGLARGQALVVPWNPETPYHLCMTSPGLLS